MSRTSTSPVIFTNRGSPLFVVPRHTSDALNVIDSAITKAQARNSGAAIEKLQELRQQLTHDVTTGQPFPQQLTATKLLQLKRGVGDLVSSWTREKSGPVKQILPQVYHALDAELDRAVPQSAQLNQRISSLITGSKDAKATALGRRRGLVSQIVQRGVIPAAIGGEGYRERGPAGAVAGFAAGQALASPAAKMALARMLKAGMPEILARGLVASGYGQDSQPTAAP